MIPKFDVCLMNPPYGDGNHKGLHYEFVEKVIESCTETFCIMPFSLINKYSKTDLTYKPILGPHTVYAEEINGDIFPGTNQHNVGIYKFTDKVNSNGIHIKYINGDERHVTSLANNHIDAADPIIKNITDIISSIGNYTYNMRFCGKFSNVTSDCKKANITNQDDIDKLIYDKIADNCNRQLPKNKIYLMVNMANGAMNGHYITGNPKSFMSVNEVIETLYSLKRSTGFNFMIFNTEIELKNCVTALENPLLRMLLSIVQYDQNMTITNCYQYIPDIDWSDQRVVTDEGLLKVCGCPADKCKEYADYCRKYMEEFDKQHQSKKNNKK